MNDAIEENIVKQLIIKKRLKVEKSFLNNLKKNFRITENIADIYATVAQSENIGGNKTENIKDSSILIPLPCIISNIIEHQKVNNTHKKGIINPIPITEKKLKLNLVINSLNTFFNLFIKQLYTELNIFANIFNSFR